MQHSDFEWDEAKNIRNIQKHGVSFDYAQRAFVDKIRIIAIDETHSVKESRFYCIGKIDEGIMTVRFTIRNSKQRIFGAGYWRKGKRKYEEHNKIH
jgi:hypothetical protein